jgi:hypothetical protein
MTREEHLQWAKDRANEYVDAGDLQGAYASMTSDLNKHPETEGHQAIMLGLMLMAGGHLSSKREMKNFIDGFN